MRILVLFLLLLNRNLNAQLNFQFSWGDQNIENNKRYYFNEKDWIEFSELKIYLSNYSLSKSNGGIILKLVDLIDNENADSKVILDSLNLNFFETLTFQFGLDSVINTSGILDGALDPIHGMYWAWNSGYIHLKMVGKSSLVSSTKNEFEFHLGGYRNPNETYFDVTLPIKGNTLKLNLKHLFLNHIDFNKTTQIMIPGTAAKKISDATANLFSIE
ncbi:MAG: MbnP family protein [Bacteroidota bacterium]